MVAVPPFPGLLVNSQLIPTFVDKKTARQSNPLVTQSVFLNHGVRTGPHSRCRSDVGEVHQS